MSDPQDRLKIELDISTSNPQILRGLDELLRLGLLSDEQVRQLCEKSLTTALPELPVTEEETEPTKPEAESRILPPPATPAALPKPPPKPSYMGQAVRSLMAELSVQWLLFLGVFMVTLSSGVLAATKWEQFPPFAQYLVLFAYTCLFWLVSQWTVKQSNLQLTAQTLQTATMLLVPLNFWAMDGFGLWNSPLGLVTVAIAGCALTGMTISIYRNFHKFGRSSPLPWFNHIVLSILHWGWAIPIFPLIAVYLGTIASSVTTFATTQTQSAHDDDIQGLDRQKTNQRSYLLVLYGTAVILFRGIFLQGIAIHQLGLAIGISGWLFVWLSEENEPDSIRDRATVTRSPKLALTQLGHLFLLAGWCISFFTIPWASDTWQPWEALQAIGVSILALWLLFRRFLVGFKPRDLVAIFFIGLQACILLRQVIPPGLRSQAVNTGVELVQAADAPFTIYAITLIPYLILTVWFTDWIYRQDNNWIYRRQETPNATQCGQTGDLLSLFLAVAMASLSLSNANVRSLNLIATAIILAVMTYRRLMTGIGLPNAGKALDYSFPPETSPSSAILLSLTHLTTLLTGASLIDRFLPNVSLEIWGTICLGVTIAEWIVYLWAEQVNIAKKTPPYISYCIEQTSYSFGLILAAVSYYVFALSQKLYLFKPGFDASSGWLMWLLAPISLTAVAYRSRKKRTLSSCFSTIALVLVNVMLFPEPVPRLIGLGIATIVMLANTVYLRATVAAVITIGFGLFFAAFVLNFGVFGLPKVVWSGWFVATSITIASLVVLHKYFTAKIKTAETTENRPNAQTNQKPKTLANVYAPAVNGWAIFLCTGLLIILTVHSFSLYWDEFFIEPNRSALIATIVVVGAIAYRNFPVFNHPSIYTLAWCLEILAAETLAFFDRSILILAIANIVLGLTAQLLGDWLSSHGPSAEKTIPRSWDIIPLAYAVLGASLRSGTVASWTGFTTLGLAFTAIGVGRRTPGKKFLVYLALIGVWLSAYEVLSYQISSLGIGDRLVAIASLTTGILYAYRLLAPWLTYYLQLSLEEIAICAHIHWAIGSSVLIAAIAFPISINMLLGIGTGVLLARYAMMQGRHHSSLNVAETWVYLGLLETAALLAYGVTRLPDFWLNWIGAWAGAIATLVAYFFYFIPWDKWGWPLAPWRKSAIILPITIAFIFGGDSLSSTFVPSSLLIPAGFYSFLAWFHRRSVNACRFTYLSGLLINWAILRWLVQVNVTEELYYISPIALFILYIAQVDPALKKPDQKEFRHTMRLFATGAICVGSLVTANWLITGAIALVAIFAGLILRVRAYLYVGTVVFLLNAIYQMVILSYQHTQLKWAIGLCVGIAFIWIAATFERSRQQIVVLVQQAIAELETWE